jgi:uncharacterized damage-inducible protein DinB
MKRTLANIFAASLVSACALQAQNPMSTELKQSYTGIKTNLLKLAEKVPEDSYSFKATPDVRTIGQLLGHIADAQTRTCSTVLGDPKPATAGSKTSKADLVAALKDSIALCDSAFDALTDANAADMIKAGQRQRTRYNTLVGVITHDNEEYGYLAVYLRLKGIVPPSSEGR